MPWSLLIPKGEFGNAAPELDPPDRVPLRQVLLVASSPRTGSNLLCRGLVGTGLAGQPEEYLNPHWSYLGWRRRVNRPSPTTRGAIGMMKRRLFGDEEWWRCYRWRPSSAKEYLAKVIDLRTSPNGVFSVKIHGLQFSHWQEEYGFDPSHWVDVPIRWVWLTRDDLMAQAVSYEIALQTNRWSVMADPSTKNRTAHTQLRVDRRRLHRCRPSRAVHAGRGRRRRPAGAHRTPGVCNQHRMDRTVHGRTARSGGISRVSRILSLGIRADVRP